MARHKKHDDHEEHASEAWLVAFADMMTLLMVTFLMMFAISSLDLQKFKTFQEAFEQGVGSNTHALAADGAPAEGTPRDVPIGSTEGTPNPKPSPVPPESGELLQREDLADLKAQVDAAVAVAGLQDAVQSEMEDRGLVLYVTSGVLFDASRAQLRSEGKELLTRLTPVLSPIANDLVVEGHTDSRPINTREFPSNWELSTARATAVLRHLLAAGVVSPTRLSAAGYADTHPRDSGTGAAALAANRRVDIVVTVPTAEAAGGAVAAEAAPAAAAEAPVPAEAPEAG